MDSGTNSHHAKAIEVLETGHALLMAGAGSSQFVGYPTWRELVDLMKSELESPPGIDGIDDLAVAADHVRSAVVKRDGDDARYKQFLERTFRPHGSRLHEQLHEDLLCLRICGVCTTNYDQVLESAITARQIGAQVGVPRCESIDLCDDGHRYRVPRFLRSLSRGGDLRSVLHLHGFHTLPERMVVTSEDFKARYGEPEGHGVHGGARLTFHERVLWSLSAMHSILFVGFSFTDPYFMRVLEVSYRDFERPVEHPHVALYPVEEGEDREQLRTLLEKYGVIPIFFDVTTEAADKDFGALRTLVEELRELVGEDSPAVTRRINSAQITQRMLEK